MFSNENKTIKKVLWKKILDYKEQSSVIMKQIRWYLPRTNSLNIARYVYVCILSLVWIGIGIGVFVYRSQPTSHIMTHYTNWNWIILITFLFLSVICAFDSTRRAELNLLSFFYLPVLTSNTIVFYIVLIILHDNPDILLDESTLFGGTYYIGNVFVYNALLHNFPYIVILYYSVLMLDRLCKAYHVSFYLFDSYWYKAVFIVYQILSSIFLPVLYDLIFDIRTTYGLTTSPFVVGISLFGIWLFGVFIPFIGILCVYNYYEIRPKTKILHRYRMKVK